MGSGVYGLARGLQPRKPRSWVSGGGGGMGLGPGAAISALPISLRMPAFIDLQT